MFVAWRIHVSETTQELLLQKGYELPTRGQVAMKVFSYNTIIIHDFLKIHYEKSMYMNNVMNKLLKQVKSHKRSFRFAGNQI